VVERTRSMRRDGARRGRQKEGRRDGSRRPPSAP
jgi:hypothetical protein